MHLAGRPFRSCQIYCACPQDLLSAVPAFGAALSGPLFGAACNQRRAYLDGRRRATRPTALPGVVSDILDEHGEKFRQLGRNEDVFSIFANME